jgi:hypothetical protein
LGALQGNIEDHEKELKTGSHTVDSSWPKGVKNAKKMKEREIVGR